MSVMTAGKPRGLTRAGAPARRPAGAARRGQPARPPRPERRPLNQPGARTARHLRAVPDAVQAAPGGRDRAGVLDVPAVPHPRRPGQTGRAGEPHAPRQAARAREAHVAPPRSTIRLTRRGRVVVAMLLAAVSLLLAALAWMAIAARAQAADSGPPPGARPRKSDSGRPRPAAGRCRRLAPGPRWPSTPARRAAGKRRPAGWPPRPGPAG